MIGQVGQTLVAIIVGGAGRSQPVLNLLRIGVDRHLHLVHNRPKIGVEARVQNLAEVLQTEAFVGGSFGDAYPGNIALPDVLNPRRAVHKVVNLALQDRLKIRLHLPAGHLDDDPQVHVPLIRDVIKCLARRFRSCHRSRRPVPSCADIRSSARFCRRTRRAYPLSARLRLQRPSHREPGSARWRPAP